MRSRLFTVGVPVFVYRPVDARQLASVRAAHARLLTFHREHPERVATLVRRVPASGQPVRIFAPNGLLVTTDSPKAEVRLYERLRRLQRDCQRSGLVLGVSSWCAVIDVQVPTQRERSSADTA